MPTGTYTPHTWVERTGTGAQKAGWLNNAETQYDEAVYYLDSVATHSSTYYTEAQCDAKYFGAGTDGAGSGFVCEKLDGYTAAQLIAQMGTSGMIIIWTGATVDIPSGWVACDGGSGTPDLRDRIPVAAGDSYELNATGGAPTVQSTAKTVTIGGCTLTTDQIPAHAHGSITDRFLDTLVDGKAGAVVTAVYNYSTTNVSYTGYTGGGGSHTHAGSTLTGAGVTDNNLPAYRAYNYIMKT